MPELPEVEALAHFLREHAVGRAIDRIDVASLSVVKTFDPPISALQGRRIERVGRVGKYLLCDCDGLILVLHFARAGWLKWSDALAARPVRPGRGALALRVHLGPANDDLEGAGGDPADGSDGTVGFDVTEAGTRKALGAWIVSDPRDVPGVERLGPDAAALDVAGLADIASSAGNKHIRTVLTDQSMIAGIGGGYADEILHRARLSPFTPTGGLDPARLDELHEAMRGVLAEAVQRLVGREAARLKTLKRDGLRIHGRAGQPCPVCGEEIRQVVYEEHSMEYCPVCQTGGRILADRRLSRLLR